MLCDTCTKSTVCRLKEDCNRLERSIKGNHVEDILSVNVKCKEYGSCNQTAFKIPTTTRTFPTQPTCTDKTPYEKQFAKIE